MSLLDRAKNLDVNESLGKLLDSWIKFYTDDNLDQKTELSPFQIDMLTRVQYKDDMYKQEFGVDMKLHERVVKRLERKYVSKNRSGRAEAVTVFATQLDRILSNPAKLMGRLFGGGDGGGE